MLWKAAIALIVASLTLSWWLYTRNQSLSANNARLEREVAVQAVALTQIKEARVVLKAHLDREERESAKLEAKIADMRQKDGVDAPLSPYERALLDNLLRP